MPGPELTPEDRLLEIIENPPRQGMDKEPAVSAAPVKDLASFVAFIRAFDLRSGWQKADLGHLNKFVFAVAVVLTIICVFNFKSTMSVFDAKFKAITAGVTKPEADVERETKDVNFQMVMTLAKEHNIFSLTHDATSMEGLLVGDGQQTANLKLVGILWSDNPQAMVENTVEQKTYLLAVGDQVAQLTVKAITKDKVILSRQDRVWELR